MMQVRRCIIALFVLFTGFTNFSKAQNSQPLSLSLIIPISTPDGQREISLERYHRLQVLIHNQSSSPQKIWKDWNTWGFFNLTLVWKVGPKTFKITKKTPKAWDGDFPDFWIINPNEFLVLEVDMTTAEWNGFPDLYGEEYNATIQAFYENKADPLSSEFGIWVGKIQSQILEVVFR